MLQDAKHMQDKLRTDCGFSDTAVATDVTRTELLREIGRLADRVQRDERPQVLLFYFSGHGYEKHGVNYLCTIDGQQVNLNDEVIAPLNKTGSKHIIMIILDCCR